MADSDLLLTIAEVSVAFGGFAGLVGLLGRSASRDDPRVLGLRMRGMILFSLAALAFSLLPSVLHRYGLEERSVWRLSSGLLAAVLALIGAWLVAALRRARRVGLPQRRIAPLIAVVLFVTLVGAVVLLLANALALAPGSASALYLTGLGMLLFLAGFAFTLILFSLLPDVGAG